MKQKRSSFGFLMEMIWVSGFFLISACIFVLVFAKSEALSRRAELLNQAVLAASSAMEETFADAEERMREEGSHDRKNPADKFSTDEFLVEITASEEDDLLSVTVQVLDREDGSVLYTLSGARALRKGGTS